MGYCIVPDNKYRVLALYLNLQIGSVVDSFDMGAGTRSVGARTEGSVSPPNLGNTSLTGMAAGHSVGHTVPNTPGFVFRICISYSSIRLHHRFPLPFQNGPPEECQSYPQSPLIATNSLLNLPFSETTDALCLSILICTTFACVDV